MAVWGVGALLEFVCPETPTGLRLSSDQLTLYCTLGICLCAIFCCFLVALASFLRRRGEPLPSQPAGPRGSQANSPHAHRKYGKLGFLP